VMEGEFELPFF